MPMVSTLALTLWKRDLGPNNLWVPAGPDGLPPYGARFRRSGPR
jgi:hypothetical protein